MRYALVSWLFVLSAIAYLDRTNISIAGIQISREYGLDNTHLGWLISMFLLGYALFQIPAGLLVQRYGSRISLLAGVLWWGLCTALTTAVPSGIRGRLLILLAVRFALGAGESVMYPAAAQFVGRWFRRSEFGRANGIIFGGVGAGSGLTPPLITFIVLHLGWRASFWVSALIGIVAGVVWYLVARDTPEEHAYVSPAELALIASDRNTVDDAPQIASSQPDRSWITLLLSRNVILLTLSYFAFGYAAWIFFGWFYLYLAQVRGFDLKASAALSSLPFLAMTVGCLFGGRVSDRLSERWGSHRGRRGLGAVCLTLTAVLLVAGARLHSNTAASLTLALGAGILYFCQSSYWAMAGEIAGKHTSVISGAMNIGAQLGGAATGTCTPLIAEHFGWEASFAAAAIMAIAGAIAWFSIAPHATIEAISSSAEVKKLPLANK